jgi:hypothetical protein
MGTGGRTGAIHGFRWMAAVSASLFVLDTAVLRRWELVGWYRVTVGDDDFPWILHLRHRGDPSGLACPG